MVSSGYHSQGLAVLLATSNLNGLLKLTAFWAIVPCSLGEVDR
jgi:hypothetical protein